MYAMANTVMLAYIIVAIENNISRAQRHKWVHLQELFSGS